MRLDEKQREIEDLKHKSSLKTPESKSKKKKKDKSESKSSKKKKDRIDSDEEEKINLDMRKTTGSGLDTDDVMKLIKTVVESTNAGIPIETQTLGRTGAIAQTLPQDFIKDLETIQKDKINFIGSKGGSSVMNATALTRRDKIHLVKLGLGKGLVDNEIDEFLAAEPSLEKELSDPNTACKINLKFSVFKAEDNPETLSSVPTKMHMTFNFFSFPESNSTELKLTENEAEDEPRKVVPDKSYGLVRIHYDENQADVEDRKACRFEFKVDPTLSRVKDENLAFVKYLKERVLSVDLVDSYSKIHFGTAKIPLVNLLRQGKDLQSAGLECDV